MKGLEKLNVFSELSRKNPNWIYRDLFRTLHKEDIWIAAYENIKGNKGALTPGVTNETLDGMGIERLKDLQQKVVNESYKFNPVKQIFIPKADGRRRPLGLPTPDDKIVQEVIRMLLAAIYEPVFDNRSFGFRNGIGVHNGLQHVEKEFQWMDWVIKGDIKDAYPTIEHKTLCEILSRTIADQRFLNLIRKSLKGGVYTNPDTLYSKLGVPQGSIVSPILANIYYHELDTWVKLKEEEVYSEKSTKRHPEYKRIENQIQKISKQIDETERNSEERNNLIREIKQLRLQRNQTPSLVDQGIKIQYVRYADDWMIGVKGSRKLAQQIKEEVTEFLRRQLKQELDPVKTKIIDLRAGKVCFLGYDIFLPRNPKLQKYKKKDGKQTIRRSTRQLRFQLPIEKVLKRLKERGYITYEENKPRPISKSSYTPLEDEVIVNHFKSVWTGLLNFYSGSTNWSHLQYIHYLLHMSCAMTLGHRHRMSSSKIFQKHGKRLEIIKKQAETAETIAYFPYKTSWKISERKWYVAKTFKDPFSIYAHRISKSRLDKPCSICQIKTNIEMHHVKHVRQGGYRYQGFHGEMALLNRKQIPLCRNCHMGVHRGEYDGVRLSTLD